MKHLITAAKREAAMRRTVYKRAIDRGTMTADDAHTKIREMDDIASLLEDFAERIIPIAHFARRLNPDQPNVPLLTIAADPRLDITAADMKALAGLYWRNHRPETTQQQLNL